jgi:hypothetical protein
LFRNPIPFDFVNKNGRDTQNGGQCVVLELRHYSYSAKIVFEFLEKVQNGENILVGAQVFLFFGF